VARLVEYWRATEGAKYTPRSFESKNYYATIFAADLGERLAETVTVADVLEWYGTHPSERHAAAAGKPKRHRKWGDGTRKNDWINGSSVWADGAGRSRLQSNVRAAGHGSDAGHPHHARLPR